MSDLDRIIGLVRKHQETCWDRAITQSCLDLVREVRFWRELMRERMILQEECPGCEYRIEIEAVDLYRRSNLPHPRCMQCGSLLGLRLTEAGSNIPRELQDRTVQVTD